MSSQDGRTGFRSFLGAVTAKLSSDIAHGPGGVMLEAGHHRCGHVLRTRPKQYATAGQADQGRHCRGARWRAWAPQAQQGKFQALPLCNPAWASLFCITQPSRPDQLCVLCTCTATTGWLVACSKPEPVLRAHSHAIGPGLRRLPVDSHQRLACLLHCVRPACK